MKIRTIAQERAQYALEKVLEISKECNKEEFKSFSAGIPSMILQNGFGQVLAFLLAKGTCKHLAMVDIIREWLIKRGMAEGKDNLEFIRNINNLSQDKYLAAQNETLKLLEWVKRYANADLGVEDESK